MVRLTLARLYLLDLSQIGQAHVSLAGAGVAWPTGLRVHADNAPSETKNQYCFYWGAWMLDLGLFNQAQLD